MNVSIALWTLASHAIPVFEGDTIQSHVPLGGGAQSCEGFDQFQLSVAVDTCQSEFCIKM